MEIWNEDRMQSCTWSQEALLHELAAKLGHQAGKTSVAQVNAVCTPRSPCMCDATGAS